MKKICALILTMACLLVATACDTKDNTKETTSAGSIPVKETVAPVDEVEPTKDKTVEAEVKEPIVKKPDTYTATITSFGDIMFHVPQLQRAYNEVSDSFDFTEVFDKIGHQFPEEEYVIGNLETTLAGKDEGIRLDVSNYFKGYQGYPTFNAPEILAMNLKKAGVDMVMTANNHSFDSWTGGIGDTINNLDKAQLAHIGTYKEKDDPKSVVTKINGINFGFSNYTYATNGIIPPAGYEYMINTWDNYREDLIHSMYQDIKDFTQNNPQIDVNMVYLHFGHEYVINPSATQRKIATELIKAGADIIIGSHPHVLQPIERIETVDDDGNTQEGLIIYSLGNFISSQIYLKSDPVPKDSGIITKLKFIKKENEPTVLSDIELVPTWVQWTDETIRVIAVEDGVNSYKESNDIYNLTEKDYKRLLQVQKFTIPHMLKYLKEDLPDLDIKKIEEKTSINYNRAIEMKKK